jgi:hypothetical protein
MRQGDVIAERFEIEHSASTTMRAPTRRALPAGTLAAAVIAVLGTACDSLPKTAGLPPSGSASGLVEPATRWTTVHEETFERIELAEAPFRPDEHPDDGWLVVEGYSRAPGTRLHDLAAVVPDPAGGPNRVLRLASPAHTDAVVVRPAALLPDRYRISLRVGYPSFGDGAAGGKNGYRGGERAEPWLDADATTQNGFYWLSILDAQPRPHNNVWIHHHRKVVIDSDNHFPPWMERFVGQRFVSSGAFPIMMFALDGKGPDDPIVGRPFLSYAAGEWQPSGQIRMVDAYRTDRWYRVAIERVGERFTLEISGDFLHGGERTYRASIDAAARCVLHYNRTPDEMDPRCADETSLPDLGPAFPGWPRGSAYPDWFFFGDPHENYYTGQIFYDDVRLEVPAPPR